MTEWEETCAVTSTPIYKTDEVVMIVPSDTAFHALNLSTSSVASIHSGKYDGLGWIDKLPATFLFDMTSMKSVFVHRLAWVLLSRGADYQIKPPLGFERNLWCELTIIIQICEKARINLLAGVAFKGMPPPVRESADKISQIRMAMHKKWQ